ncbi:MAG: ABC transporter permease [Terracidiphilus sp.]
MTDWQRRFWFWLRQMLFPGRRRSDLDEELRFHLEQAEDSYRANGLSAAEAHRRALVDFGAVERVREESNRQRPGWWLETVAQDLGYGWRLLVKNPSFTMIAAGSLALAIGANTAIFSIAKEMLLDQLAVERPERLRLLGWIAKGETPVHSYRTLFDATAAGMSCESFSYPVFRQLQAADHSMQGLLAFEDLHSTAVVRGLQEPVRIVAVSGSYYGVLGVRPQLGRPIQPGDDGAPGAGAVAVLSERLWERGYGRSPAAIGQTIRVNQVTLTIVGVNPRSFTGAGSVQDSPDLFVPMSMMKAVDPWGGVGLSPLTDASFWGVEVMGRLRPGVSEEQARAELDAELAAAVRATMTVKPGETMPRMALADGSRGLHQMDRVFSKPVNVLLVVVGLVLLLASANVANLQLARGAQRGREMSVRLALGAGRGRVLRQLLTENLLLAALGGAGGLLVGYLGRNGIPALLAGSQHGRPIAIQFDWKVFAFSAGVTLLTGPLFGLAPAWRAARADGNGNLQEGAQTVTRRRRGLGGKALVGAQIALSTLLVIGAGLFVRTVVGLNSVETGFRTDHMLLAPVYPPPDRFPAKKNVRLMGGIEEAITAIPGVEAATAMSNSWLGGGWGKVTFRTEDEVAHPEHVPAKHESGGEPAVAMVSDAAGKENLSVRMEQVGNGFFQTMGVPLRAGRGFGPRDTVTSPKVAIINERLARERFPNSNPIGKRFTLGSGGKPDWIEVVGVCGNSRYDDLRSEAPAQFFMPYVQSEELYGMNFVVRTHLPAAAIMPALRRAVASVDSDLSIEEIRSQQEMIDETMRMERALALLTAGFGVLALALACVGIYGVMAYSVAQRTSEIGIRLALGAEPRQVRSSILRESAWVAAAGIGVGLAAALALTRLVQSMLYGIGPHDPLTLGCGAALLMFVALAATWIPARRAASIEPMVALRHE